MVISECIIPVVTQISDSYLSLGASIEKYNNEAWDEDNFKIIFKIPFYSVDKKN